MKNRLRFFFDQRDWARVTRLFILSTSYNEGREIDYHANISFTEIEEATTISDSHGLVMNAEERQDLMDALWSIGTRPTEGAGSAGALAATVKHLEDMRKLVFDMFEKGGN